MLTVKVKKLVPGARLPRKATPGSAFYDVCSVLAYRLFVGSVCMVRTGLAFELSEGYEMEVRPRSSLSFGGVLLVNSPGTLDSDYRGELYIALMNCGTKPYILKGGDRVAQVAVRPVPTIDFVEAETLAETVRDSGGFGSTGR